MSVDELVAAFATINDRASLIAFLTPLRLPHGLSERGQARITVALLTAASRCWKGRVFPAELSRRATRRATPH